MGFDLQNPAVTAVANVFEVFTNIPVARVNQKLINLREAADARNQYWQRITSFLGYSPWDIGAEIEEVEEVKERIKKEKKTKKKQPKKKEKSQEKQVLESQFEKDQNKERKQGKKDVTCIAVSGSGNRCQLKSVGKSKYCTIHQEVEQRSDGKKTQCRKWKSDKSRCKMQTSNKSGYCYYHD